MYGYVYLTTNLVNQRKYIGRHKASEFTENYKGSGKILWQAIRKYGWDNFKVELLEECSSSEELNQAEIKWIAKFDATNSNEFYNLARGGNCIAGSYPHPMLGKFHSEESKMKMSESASKRVGESNHFYGKSHSEVSKAKMRESHRLNPSDSHTTLGRIWVNDGIRNYAILPEGLDNYLDKGFNKGFLSKEYDRRTCLGRVHVNNGEINKVILPEELPYYLSQGFVKGRLYNKVWVNKDGKSFQVEISQLSEYLSLGYSKGRGKIKSCATTIESVAK